MKSFRNFFAEELDQDGIDVVNDVLDSLILTSVATRKEHWSTKVHSYHMATGAFYECLISLTDKFVELSIGLGAFISDSTKDLDFEGLMFKDLVDDLESTLIEAKEEIEDYSELTTVIDEILQAIAKFKYSSAQM